MSISKKCKRTLVILSGGMDSAVVLAWALHNKLDVGAVNFSYGSKHNAQERLRAVALTSHYKVPLTLVDLPFINLHFKSDLLNSGGPIPEGHYAADNMKSTVVPFRNGILLSIAAGLAKSQDYDSIAYGAHTGDHAIYPDCRPEFLASIQEAIREGTDNGISVLAPFMSIDKGEILAHGLAMGVPFHLTYTCYAGGTKHCGKCGSCTERLEAFAKCNVVDPVPYMK